MGSRPMDTYRGACHCGLVRFEIETDFPELTTYDCSISFHRKRVTPDYFGINVFCLEGFDPAGIPVRATVGAAMP